MNLDNKIVAVYVYEGGVIQLHYSNGMWSTSVDEPLHKTISSERLTAISREEDEVQVALGNLPLADLPYCWLSDDPLKQVYTT